MNILKPTLMSRRDHLRLLGTGALAGGAAGLLPTRLNAGSGVEPSDAEKETPAQIADRVRRMKWWHEARFGMFIHFGLYSVIGQHEWAMELEGIPVAQYEILAKHFNPRPTARATGPSLPNARGRSTW